MDFGGLISGVIAVIGSLYLLWISRAILWEFGEEFFEWFTKISMFIVFLLGVYLIIISV